MITWQDFILDDVIGPVLAFEGEDVEMRVTARRKSCREARLGSPDIMEDVGTYKEAPECASIQETRQEIRPARMVGQPSLDFALLGMDADRSNRAHSRRREGG